MDDDEIKSIRGKKANYDSSINKILELIKIKKSEVLRHFLCHV